MAASKADKKPPKGEKEKSKGSEKGEKKGREKSKEKSKSEKGEKSKERTGDDKKKKKKKKKKGEEEKAVKMSVKDKILACPAAFKSMLKRGKKKDADGKEAGDSESGVDSSTSELRLSLERQLSATVAPPPTNFERAMQILCCVYCRTPKIDAEEAPEEKERREMVERLTALRDKEIERIKLKALAEETVTVMYNRNAKELLEEWVRPTPTIEALKQEEAALENSPAAQLMERGSEPVVVELKVEGADETETTGEGEERAGGEEKAGEQQDVSPDASPDALDPNSLWERLKLDANVDGDSIPVGEPFFLAFEGVFQLVKQGVDGDDLNNRDVLRDVLVSLLDIDQKGAVTLSEFEAFIFKWRKSGDDMAKFLEAMASPEDEDEDDDEDDDDEDDDDASASSFASDLPSPLSPPPSPRAQFYRAAHCHSYSTIFGDEVAPLIHLSAYHTPQTAAPEFVAAMRAYASTYIETKRDMSKYIVNLQCVYRIRQARRGYAARLVEKAAENELLALQIQAEKENWNAGFDRFTAICNAEAKKVAHVATNYWRIPAAATVISRSWRGFRVRVRIPDFRKRVYAQRQRRLERSRYLRALELAYGNGEEKRTKKEQIEKMQYSRKMKGGYNDDRGGWKPEYEAAGDLDLWSHIWTPPTGSQFGVRNLKVKMPPRSYMESKVVVQDRNSWIGIPVMMKKAKSKERTLGAPDRFNTLKGFEHIKSSIPKAPEDPTHIGDRSSGDKFYKLRYNWIPMNILEKGNKIAILEDTFVKYEEEKREHDRGVEKEREERRLRDQTAVE